MGKKLTDSRKPKACFEDVFVQIYLFGLSVIHKNNAKALTL